MKKFSSILIAFGLFVSSLGLALWQTSLSRSVEAQWVDASLSAMVQPKAGLFETGFARFMDSLLSATGHNVALSMVLLALVVELVLLYPGVSLQLKQKKIHLFHKKIIDRFRHGELAMSSTREELHKIYDVNEKIHARGALLVVVQVVVLLITLIGLSGWAHSDSAALLGVSDFRWLANATGFGVPLLASLVYFFHAVTKIYWKEKEDYISRTQTGLGLAFALLGATAVFYFAHWFPMALVMFFVTLVTFSTIRYGIVERHARQWGALAQHQLLQMLREAKPHNDRFEFLSRQWSHLPVIRHLNFSLLEEATSMALGLLLALTFFGAFHPTNVFYANEMPNSITVMLEVLPPANN
jgi:hypothetical protein